MIFIFIFFAFLGFWGFFFLADTWQGRFWWCSPPLLHSGLVEGGGRTVDRRGCEAEGGGGREADLLAGVLEIETLAE